MKTILKAILLALACLLAPSEGAPPITLGNTGKPGLWEENFDGIADWVDDGTNKPDVPPGLCFSNRRAAGGTNWGAVGAAYGRSGKGFRHWHKGGSGADFSATVGPLHFGPASEVWMRMYMKWGPITPAPTGGIKKIFYLRNTHAYGPVESRRNNASILDITYRGILTECYGRDWSAGQKVVGTGLDSGGTMVTDLGGWHSVWSDGTWHALEQYVDNTTGTWRVWVDGVLRMEYRQVYPADTWESVQFLENGNLYANATSMSYIDVDDLAIADNTYAGFAGDAQGNKMIGPVAPAPAGAPGSRPR
jgi:hypothetical protein